MSHHSSEIIWKNLPKGVSVREFLLALHLAPAKGMTWPYITKQYPRSLSEVILDPIHMQWSNWSHWRSTEPARLIGYCLRLILIALVACCVYLYLLHVEMPTVSMMLDVK